MPFDPQFQLQDSTRGFQQLVEHYSRQEEDRAREKRQLAREFKANQELAEIAFGVPKEESLTMGGDALRGFIQGNMAKRDFEEKQQRATFQAMADLSRMRDLNNETQAFEALKRFSGNFAQQIHPQLSPQLGDYYENPEKYQARPPIDALAAMADSLVGNEAATAHPQFENLMRLSQSFTPDEVIDVDGNKFLRNAATRGLHPIQKQTPSGKTPAVPITDEEGNVIGHAIPNSRGGLTQLRQPTPPTAKRHPLQTRLDALEAKLEAARADRARKHEVPGLEAEAASLRKKIAGDTKDPSSEQPVKVRKYDPATGKFN